MNKIALIGSVSLEILKRQIEYIQSIFPDMSITLISCKKIENLFNVEYRHVNGNSFSKDIDFDFSEFSTIFVCQNNNVVQNYQNVYEFLIHNGINSFKIIYPDLKIKIFGKNTYFLKKKFLSLLEKINFFLKCYGKNYFCPFCNKTSRKMLPTGVKSEFFKKYNVIGGGYRENALCPHCGSFDRERLLYLFLKENTSIFTDKNSVLHMAPEKRLTEILKQNRQIEYYTCDLYSQDVMYNMDITDLKFEDNKFDIIICNHVLEHIDNDIKAMKELYRVLKKDGKAILQVPLALNIQNTYEDRSVIDEDERENKFGQKDHVRIYGMDYMDRLRSVGFSVFEWKTGPEVRERYSLIDKEFIIWVTK
ncbi:MAG: class I SAM-dependent methyltransferase [Candidatus Muirbacterium halophilum]|nr:class I SAM-dependent methyltransferase [Candidatus Muirbacterium halophilum]MCK9474600.1 class I SAM-dependent methyltransferase [Candidatus Muirbacterium halophilum]